MGQGCLAVWLTKSHRSRLFTSVIGLVSACLRPSSVAYTS